MVFTGANKLPPSAWLRPSLPHLSPQVSLLNSVLFLPTFTSLSTFLFEDINNYNICVNINIVVVVTTTTTTSTNIAVVLLLIIMVYYWQTSPTQCVAYNGLASSPFASWSMVAAGQLVHRAAQSRHGWPVIGPSKLQGCSNSKALLYNESVTRETREISRGLTDIKCL